MQSNRVSWKHYKYTKDNVYLTDEQRDFYEKNGYIVVRNLVDWDILDECKQRFIDVCNNNSDAVVYIVMKDAHLKSKNVKGEYAINKIQDILFDEIFFKYVSYQPMIDIVQSIIGPNITSVTSMLINKPPNSIKDSSRHPLHQDLHYFPFRPADSAVGTWTAMETANVQNGCLFVVPGSHKDELMKHEYPPNAINKAYHGVVGQDHRPTVNLIMEKGDTLFFHPLLLHGSGHNLTKGFRKAISCHYADSNCRSINVRGTLQEDVAREVIEMAVKKGLANATFHSIWKAKSRLIRGEPGNFQKIDSHL